MVGKRVAFFVMCGVVALAIAASVSLTTKQDIEGSRAQSKMATEKAVARAGARIIPTEPTLAIEPR